MDFKLVLNELMASFSNLPTSKENEANKNNEVIRKDEGDLVQDILPPSQPVTI